MPQQVAERLLSWASDIEPGTIEQAARAARLPFVPSHVALMPDAHVGMGATVGSVIPTQGAIIPSAVGVDIGCGMVATETSLTAADLPDGLAALMPLVERRIPAGVGRGHDDPRVDSVLAALGRPHTTLTGKQETTTATQFGTLGSGNHFVEVCLDERDHVWTVLHSGSRGIGNQLATRHIGEAKKLMKQYFITLEDPDLAYLVQGTPQFTAYIEDMLWAQRYAMASRARMAEVLVASLFEVVGHGSALRTINAHHNFTQLEHHHGRDVWITRKGAIKAARGDEGIIPGSMGTRSYIVTGLGSSASYNSCSHGAGRRMSRTEARKKLTAASLAEAMGTRTWNADRAAALVDEHPEAYKSIDQVMEDQRDLVTVQHTLRQVFNYKG
ncbi:tRNA-splicing ligase RtcB [Streptosporangium becharense]|uniref:3'-phosphate/5'-hydroxy nucleic acid ligase n=1 Tax=Streptosporangium becharense TaxID=1816182 RepID=A0A7W9IN14_9ACTN|nr:RtcB family protein [Streptosporangium becharense]MBB2914271.1 tRNA-splicing ligase RtcB [Streptosporangium becharense]MBB5823697.1 tRNA-splicing ligase RtcB [Streptosporangium becharense]